MATKPPDAPALPSTRSEAKRLGITRYFTGAPCANGHVSPRWTASHECCECALARQRSEAGKAYHAAYKRIQRQDPEFRAKENAIAKERAKSIYSPLYASCPKHRARMQANKRNYYRRLKERNPEKVREKMRRDYYRASESIEFKIKNRLRGRFHALLSGRSKASQSMDLIGCSVSDLMAYIEAKFKPGMSWDNFGEWHIDHIRPCASFDLTDHQQQRACFHFTNLQPLWAIENLSKGAKYDV